MKKLLFALLFFVSGAVSAQVSFGFSLSGPGYSGTINSYQYRSDIQRYRHEHYYRDHYRGYISPPRMPEPYYKSPNYYMERNSCFNYPVYDYHGNVIGYQIRCM